MNPSDIEEALFVDRAAFDPDAPVSPFVALQRVVVRMLFDPSFVEKVYSDRENALANLELDPQLVAQLVKNDRRLWNADRLRRSRALKILLDEFRTSGTLVLHETGRLADLDAFFSSPQFHQAVQKRGYMALAFAAYLEQGIEEGKLKSPHLRSCLTLEAAMARSRRLLRDSRRGKDAGLRALAPGTPGPRKLTLPGRMAVFLPQGSLETVNHIEKYLFEVTQIPALVLCKDAPTPDPLPDLNLTRRSAWLLEPRPGGKVDLSGIEPTFALVINACGTPKSDAELGTSLQESQISSEDAVDYANQLVDGEVLRVVQVDDKGAVREEPNPPQES